ncbi:MAG: hypothetical protein M3Q06_06830, partial [Bacteroidota bacterium]|nr:hypothetical protein [Bacteroidota bacterium]
MILPKVTGSNVFPGVGHQRKKLAQGQLFRYVMECSYWRTTVYVLLIKLTVILYVPVVAGAGV